MATLLARPTHVKDRTTTPPPQLSLNTAPRTGGAPVPVPNKHIPFCSPGPRPASRSQLDTPPSTPPAVRESALGTHSLLHPPSAYDRIVNDPPVYALQADGLNQAHHHLSSQPLPPPHQVFPWLHGLHAENQLQLAFFTARKRSLRRTPKCLRGMTIVKAGGDLLRCKLKGAVAPDEILQSTEPGETPEFMEIDPREGFSVRNFQIQTCKLATVSDIIVYGDDSCSQAEVVRLATQISQAQAAWQRNTELPMSGETRLFNTFVLINDYATIEKRCADLIAIDADGYITNKVMDFFQWERIEMCSMSAASEISHNVWLGPTPDPNVVLSPEGVDDQPDFDILVEANDMAQIPDARSYKQLEKWLEQSDKSGWTDNVIHQLEFPASGAILPPTWSHAEVDGLVEACEWIYKQAHYQAQTKKRRDSKLTLTPEFDADGDSVMGSPTESSTGRKILIHCTDGYTESSLLALAYYMYAECAPVHTAWLTLHREKRRNFFAYASDVHLLRTIQPRLMSASPKYSTGNIRSLCPPVPDWLEKMDGSLPSRIMPYMYLGNLGHANNPSLLKELGIGQVLSVGEPVNWSPAETDDEYWPQESLFYVDKIQDNGVDPLTEEFGKCLEFIENGRKKGTATLVHCRVGVSRSATICIAEIMNELGLSFPRAYCFVRARRLNVIIQPHLRFCYELLKWEEFQCQKRGKPLRREMEWATIAREIAAMNKPYSRQ